ncbi:MAG: ATP-binding protein [Clostridiales bacterium]|nr:ATP-binding protein [Clostridiales bacterium]
MIQPEATGNLEDNQYRHLRLLHALNTAATVLLAAEEGSFGVSLANSMEIINEYLDVDRVYVWKNEIIDGDLYYTHRYEWLRDGNAAQSGLIVRPSEKYRYNAEPGWRDDRFKRGECVNGPLYSLSEGEQEMLRPYGIKSLLAVPVHMHGQFWGFVSYDDCHSERWFTENEVDILRSASLMMASVISRNDQSLLIFDAHERTKLMLDSQPLGAILWNKDGGIIDCNEEVVKLFKMKDKREFIDRFFIDLSPEFQSDGKPSYEKTDKAIVKAFEEGKTVFEWVHLTADGTPMPCEVVLVRVIYEGDQAVAGFIRDLSEQKRMTKELSQRDLLLRTVNIMAGVLLNADEDSLGATLQEGISLLAEVTDVDAVIIWRNEMEDSGLYYTLEYKWLSDFGFQQKHVPDDLKLLYSDSYDDWEKAFSIDGCINSPISELKRNTRELMEGFGVKSVLMIPLYIREQFWGFISFYDCRNERKFKYDEVEILRSAALKMLNTIDRIEQSIRVREANERARLMLNATPLGCSLWDETDHCIDCNDEILTVLGIKDKHEFMDNFYCFSPEFQPDGLPSQEKSKELLRIAFAEGRYVADWLHQRMDGTPVPTELIFDRVQYGEDYVVAVYARDLREYKRLLQNEEEALLAMNKTKAILDNIDSLILVTDLDFNIVFMNHNTAKAYMLDRDACVGQKCHKTIRGYDEPCKMCQLLNLIPDKESLPTHIDDYLWDDRLEIWTESRVSIIRWVDNTLIQFRCTNDRSVKKAYEDELRKAMEASVAASASKSSFLANMSHEIRTPMNSIIGFAELAMDNEASPGTKGFLSKILESAKWLLHIINDILDISKIESGKMTLENQPFDLGNVIMSCQSLILPAAREKGLELHVQAEPLPGKMLIGDPVRLYQALLNLLYNAVKYTNTGSVGLKTSIKVKDNDSVIIYFEIKDTGIGMDDEMIIKVFEPFVQADNSITREYVGTGLGLTITKSILELMGGRLDAISAPGVGSTFFFELSFEMIDAPDDEAAEEYAVLRKPHFSGLVLLCEDNKMNQDVIREHLSRVGLDTIIAENGKIGVDMVRDRMEKNEKPFDLILMDMQMPMMGGLEAASQITALGVDTPIVVLTANIMADDVELYRKSGMSSYLGKPFSAQELWHCLLKHLTPLENAGAGRATVQDDIVLLAKLQANFVKDNRNRFEEIAKAVKEDDIELARRLAHSLKSNAGMIGKTDLQNTAARVESVLKQGDLNNLWDDLDALQTELILALRDLDKPHFTPVKNAVPEIVDAGQVRALFDLLEPMLDSINPECVNLLEAVYAVPGAEELAAQIEEYDFEAAQKSLAALKRIWV